MTKKILLGTVLFGLAGILIIGAVLRTMDKTDQVSAARNGQGRNQTAQETSVTKSASQDGNNQRGARGSRQKATNGTEERGREGQDIAQEWVMREGDVEAIDEESITVTLANGETMVIEGRVWSFAQEQDFLVSRGDHLILDGFWEDESFVVGQIENSTTNHTIVLRDETGRPSGAGGGRRGT